MTRIWLAALATLGACTDAAPSEPVDTSPVYLALGDSVAFGFDPLGDPRAAVGYPEVLAERRGIEVVNSSCPGEATGGFISSTGTDNGCRENREKYPLHTDYTGTQLAFALEFLRVHPGTELITIDIGGNDAGKLNHMCDGNTACVLGGFLGMLTEYQHNLDVIFGELRKVYDGPIVTLAIYNPYPTDTVAQYGLDQLNVALADKTARHDGVFADGMAAFRRVSADPCKDGLLIKMSEGVCDIHPTPIGHGLLADALEQVMPELSAP